MVVAASTGCKDKPPGTVSIKGKVQLRDGEPAAEMVLVFQPLDESNKHAAPSAPTDKLGNFSAQCAKGRYKVALKAVIKGGAGGPPGPGMPLPRSVPQEPTPLLIEVPENGKGDFVLAFK